ncbi:UDP-glucose 6-dehydrogenase [Anaeromyxobacter sp. Fw109-5]|nr:UDP-glucose 6-dehydrogenase [Anaeromyxobacter sp. Fw109-5]
MKICVIGTGYVGLVAGACLADSGHLVTCIDTDEEKIALLRRGRSPIYEPGLDELVERNVAQRRLAFSSNYEAVAGAEVVFLAVGTPAGEDGSADLSYLLAAARQAAPALRSDAVVVVKSTAPVGTADEVAALVRREAGTAVEVVSNPEFLREGSAIDDFLHPDRIVIGTGSPRARRTMGEVYAPIVSDESPILFMDHRSAELTKHAANAMLATRISFMNDVALLCEHVGADVNLVRDAVGADRRIGAAFLHAGVGYGGSCFPKDVSALVSTGREHGVDLEILKAVERINERQKAALLQKAVRHFRSLAGRSFAVWGLSFKPGTDDIRESPALALIEGLTGKGASVRCHDPVAEPVAMRHFRKAGSQVSYADGPYDCAEGAEALFVVTEWSQFRRPDLGRLRRLMKTPVIFDGRNLFDPAELRDAGFVYYGIGRAAPPAPEALAAGRRPRATARRAPERAAARTAPAALEAPRSPRDSRAASQRRRSAPRRGPRAPRRRPRATR